MLRSRKFQIGGIIVIIILIAGVFFISDGDDRLWGTAADSAPATGGNEWLEHIPLSGGNEWQGVPASGGNNWSDLVLLDLQTPDLFNSIQVSLPKLWQWFLW